MDEMEKICNYNDRNLHTTLDWLHKINKLDEKEYGENIHWNDR